MHKMRSLYSIDAAQAKVFKMHLNDEEKAMLNGDFGKAKQWAVDHQIKVGEFFDAPPAVMRQSQYPSKQKCLKAQYSGSKQSLYYKARTYHQKTLQSS